MCSCTLKVYHKLPICQYPNFVGLVNIKIILSVFVENIIYSKLYRSNDRLNFPPKFVKKMYFYPDFRPHRPFSDLKGTHVRTRTHSPAYASSRAPSDAYAYVHVRYFLIFG